MPAISSVHWHPVRQVDTVLRHRVDTPPAILPLAQDAVHRDLQNRRSSTTFLADI